MDLPEGVQVSEDLFYRMIRCWDGEYRRAGEVRCGPDVVRKVDFDYEEDMLATNSVEWPLGSGGDSMSGIVCHEVEKGTSSTDVVWLIVDHDSVGLRLEDYEGVLYAPGPQLVRVLESDSMGSRYWKEYKIRSDCWQFIDEYPYDDSEFIVVADVAIKNVLRRDLPSSIVSQVI